MLVYILIIVLLLLIDYFINKAIKKKLNKWYKDSIELLDKLYPLTLSEKKQAKNSYIMRIMVLTTFWLFIILLFI